MTMASRSSLQGRTNNITGTGHNRHPVSNISDHHTTKSDEKKHGMALTRKVMLCGQLAGTEMILNFEQIYTVPALQTLGVPLRLAYIPGVVSGPSSLLLLPLLGWLIDREHNSQRRKFAALVFAAALQILGMAFLLSGNAMHLRHLWDHNATATIEHASCGSCNTSGVPDMDMNTAREFGEESWLSPDGSGDCFPGNGSSEVHADNSSSVPFKAGLGLLGFILMEIGYDCSNCFIKAFTVSCSPRTEQTSLIVMGVVGSVGGVTNAALGVVDFTSHLGRSFNEGAKLTIQTSVQGLLIIMTVITGLLFTFCTGRKQLRDLQRVNPGIDPGQLSGSGNETNCIESPKHGAVCDDSMQIEHSLEEATQNGILSYEGSGIPVDPTMTVTEWNTPALSESVPLLDEDHGLEEENVKLVITGYGSTETTAQRHEESSMAQTSVEVRERLRSERTERGWLSCLKNPKTRILFVCITTFFSSGCVTLYTYAISDFVGKAVYGGDPRAEPGSHRLYSYQEGIHVASWVLLVYYVTFLVFSFLQSKVLAFLGFRLEFLLLQLLFSTMMLVTGLTSRLETVFALSVVAGMMRTCFYTMPFAVTNDIAQSIACTSNTRSPVSLVMSLVAASIPLAYCVLFSWAGALEELTGNPSAPLWLGTVYGVLGMTAFLFVGKV